MNPRESTQHMEPRRRSCATRASWRGVFEHVVPLVAAVVAGLAADGFAGAGAVETADDPAARIARMDELWAARGNADALRESMDLCNRALVADPESYEAAWRLARGYWWVAYRSEDRTLKKAMAVKAMDVARGAIALNADRVEGHYFHMLSIGEYGGSIGIVTAVRQGIGGKFENAALRAYELDRDFDGGGPMVALGRFYYLLPWPLRDLKKSRRYFEEARSRHPDTLFGRVFLAETYYALDERALARAELDFVLNAALPPAAGPDALLSKQRAAEILRKWQAS